MSENKIKLIKSKKQKTRFWRHVFVFVICLLIACGTWLSVMYTQQEQNAMNNGAEPRETACAATSPLVFAENG